MINEMPDTGAQFYRAESMGKAGAPAGGLAHGAPRDDAAVSRWLNEAGIPGIKYYDQGSRAAGEGTRNMVLFDDLARRAKVMKRDDKPIGGLLNAGD